MQIEHGNRDEYAKWMGRLSNPSAARVLAKLNLLALTGTNLQLPHVRRLGAGLCELRVDKYRLYFVVAGDTATFLAYGEKDTQQRDIQRARRRQP